MSERHPLPIVQDDEAVSRRGFLELLGAGVFLGGLAACESPRGEIVPYTRQPREVVPGKPRIYATSMIERGYATGILATSSSGRPTKVDGNPEHPATPGGGSWPNQQASILDLYDPARASGFRKGGQASSWRLFLQEARGPLREKLHVLMGPTSSPLLIAQLGRLREQLPDAVFHFYDPLHSPSEQEGLRRSFGRPLLRRYHFERAQVIASFDSDFLADPPFRVRYAHDFAENRRVHSAEDGMSRLYVAEGELGLAGALADHRLRCRPSEITALLRSLLAEIGRRQARLSGPGAGKWRRLLPDAAGGQAPHPWIRALANDLLSKQGRGLVLAGERQPAEAQILADLLNELLGNLGETVTFTEPILFEAERLDQGVGPLAAALERGEVGTLLVLGVDPLYDAPAELRLSTLLPLAKRRVYSGLWENQTSKACEWFVPGVHYLEQWGDGRAYDGTVSLIQPLIRPLYGGRSPAEILSALLGDENPDGSRLLRTSYAQLPRQAWEQALQRGFIPGALPEAQLELSVDAGRAALSAAGSTEASEGIEISIRPDLKIGGGEQGPNDWLLELPDPITRLSWGNAAQVSPATAKELGLAEGQLVEVSWQDRSIRLPLLPVQGMADRLISLRLGWGNPSHLRDWERGLFSKDHKAAGVSVYPLRSSERPWILSGGSIRASLGEETPLLPPQPTRTTLAIAQTNLDMHERPILLGATLEAYRAKPDFVFPNDEEVPDLYGSPWSYTGQQWGMSVDLNTCIGCNACVVACQAENNTPTVGRIDATKGRLMHWIRIDRYRLGESDDDMRLLPQPMMCQHCEKAPCEYVCPVNATVHSPDGLNEMVYNRCIGTRFCSNNCPYKVRRFNYFRYNAEDMPETLKMLKNPDVSVRGRGVIEKCTYCVQRIRGAQIEARIQQRELRDGEVRTACQVACPTNAIVFGLISDPESPVSKLHALSRSYGVLQAELGTEPRTRYLAYLRNPNPELDGDG